MLNKIWPAVAEYHRKSRRDRDIRHSIEYILDVNPKASEHAKHWCGMTTKQTAPLHLHTLDIGRNLWIARVADLHKYERHLIFIGERFDMELEDATRVFDDKVLVEGSWLDVIGAQLEGAKRTAVMLKAEHDAALREQTEARANAY